MEKAFAFTLFAVPVLASTLWADALSLYADVATVGKEAAYYPPPSTEEGLHEAVVSNTARVIPSAGLPASVLVAKSNNMLDVVRHQGRVYLAFRTAAHHYSDPKAVIQVVSSGDEKTWKRETTLLTGTEVREPRFLSFGDELFLYASEPAASGHPGRVLGSRRNAGGWEDRRTLDLPGQIVWNTKMQNGIPLMTTYASDTSFSESNFEVSLLTTSNGYEWHPLLAGHATVRRGGGSEAAFTGDDDGTLYTVVRSASGSQSSWGSSVCIAPASEWTNWDCVNDRRRYDSPAMFTHEGEIYLIGRRNLTTDGAYDQGFGPQFLRSITNQLNYAKAAKRCSLWRYVKSERRIAFILDLPSRGDTCSPAVITGERSGQFIVYNYSSDLAGPELSLGVGQTRPTFIYRHVLELNRKENTKQSGL